MAIFPPVIVGVRERYSDNNGAYEVSTLWDGEQLSFDSTMYNKNAPYPVVNATSEQKAQAAEFYKKTVGPSGIDKAFGHTYIVGGSRKVAKGTKVIVRDYQDSYYDSRYNQRVDAKVQVECPDGQQFWISPNCLKTWVEGVYPYWHNF